MDRPNGNPDTTHLWTPTSPHKSPDFSPQDSCDGWRQQEAPSGEPGLTKEGVSFFHPNPQNQHKDQHKVSLLETHCHENGARILKPQGTWTGSDTWDAKNILEHSAAMVTYAWKQRSHTPLLSDCQERLWLVNKCHRPLTISWSMVTPEEPSYGRFSGPCCDLL